MVTGSAGLELIAGKERFPGRRGRGRDLYMYPLSFSEYVSHFSRIRPRRAPLDDLEAFETCLAANAAFSRTLEEMFAAYLQTGGFPIPIREYFEKGRVTYLSYRAYLDWLRADWLKAGCSEGYMKEVLSYILETTSAPVTWHAIAKHTSLSSPHTAREYVEKLQASMVAKVVYWASLDGRPDYRKAKKVLLLDPFIYRVLSRYVRVSVDEAAVVEATVTAHLARRYPTYYWRDRGR